MAKPKVQQKKPVSQSYLALVWWKFKKNKVAIAGATILIIFYVSFCIIPEFLAPYPLEKGSNMLTSGMQLVRFVDSEGQFHARPFVYGMDKKIDTKLRTRVFVTNPDKKYPIHFFVKGYEYKLFGFIPANVHLFGIENMDDPDIGVHILGTDSLGRDYLSRVLYGGRLSLLIGLIGQFMTLIFGSIIGAVSGYYGGVIDMLLQRSTELLAAFPDIPLFMALSAAIPKFWSPITVYFMLTIIISFLQWGGLARQLRGMILSLREREYVLAAKSAGAGDNRIMFRHLLPGTLSHIVVIATLSIPGMILGETALSWLGLGLRPPLTSWGTLLQEAGTVFTIRFAPWELWVVIFIIITVMAFNMLGDGLRDALDPYGGR